MNTKKEPAIVRVAIVTTIVFSLFAGSGATWSMAFAQTAQTVSIKAVSLSGAALNMWTTISSPSATKTGFTPMSFAADPATTYTVTVANFGSSVFDHWDNGSTANTRTVAAGETALTAYYKTGAYNLTVKSADMAGVEFSGMYATIAAGTVLKTGFTSLSYSGGSGTYTVTVSDYGTTVFDHWDNGSTSKSRSIALGADTTVTAYYKRESTAKTGVYVALYMYPSGTGATWWQKVIDEKTKHPSVPIVITFNPNSGPGSSRDANIATWVAKLKSAGVTAIGYTYDNYGTRSLTALKADADKYKNWYNADGLFIDEFTNKVGYETHYKDLTTYAKSIGMKMTFGNPGTDVPKSYIGTVDVINITEGTGYMPISWLQYCVLCSSSNGWHYQYDKRNFAYIRYNISSLDTSFEVESSKWVGLLYITSGNDSNGRWFSLPSYFSTEVATLDR